MEPFSSRCRTQLGPRCSTRIHVMAHSDAALFQAINIFNQMFAHLWRALNETMLQLLRDSFWSPVIPMPSTPFIPLLYPIIPPYTTQTNLQLPPIPQQSTPFIPLLDPHQAHYTLSSSSPEPSRQSK
eukprot:superscaffoldBa00000097_g1432